MAVGKVPRGAKAVLKCTHLNRMCDTPETISDDKSWSTVLAQMLILTSHAIEKHNGAYSRWTAPPNES